MTDSGGVQEETACLGIPCLTLRENTERPITITQGTNRHLRVEALKATVDSLAAGSGKRGSKPPLWDGHTADRVVADLRRRS